MAQVFQRINNDPLWPTKVAYPVLAGGIVAIGLLVQRLGVQGLAPLVLAIGAATLGLIVLHRPQIGLFALVACAGVIRLKVNTGTGSPIVASLGCCTILCACWLISRHLHHQRILLLPPFITLPCLVLLCSIGFSLLWGRATIDPRVEVPSNFLVVQIAGGMLYVLSIGLLFVGSDLLRHQQARDWMVIALIAIGLVALPFRALNLAVPVLSAYGLFGTWFVGLCWSHALSNSRLHPAIRWVLGGGAIGWLIVQMSLQLSWTSGWFPPIIALLAITMLIRPRLSVPILVVGIAILIRFPTLLDGVLQAEEHQGSLGGEFGRLELWARNLEILKDQLLFGTGPGGYALYYVTLVPEEAMSTHNNYLDVLAQFGVPGLLNFLALLGGIAWLAWHLLPQLANPADRSHCVAVLGAMPGLLIAMTLGDWVVPFIYNQTIAGFDHSVYTWLMFAIVCGMWAQQRYPPETNP